eukprot:6003747-Prymnesium_polylepis.1
MGRRYHLHCLNRRRHYTLNRGASEPCQALAPAAQLRLAPRVPRLDVPHPHCAPATTEAPRLPHHLPPLLPPWRLPSHQPPKVPVWSLNRQRSSNWPSGRSRPIP